MFGTTRPLQRHAGNQMGLALLVALLPLAGGCTVLPPVPPGSPVAAAPLLENPMFVPTRQRELLWDQIVDTVDDYFDIQQEERVRLYEGTLIEGRLDTLPKIGSTVLEPWRHDSTPGPERWHATLQTVRRRASIHVIPEADGFLVDVAVYKELEDLQQPENATVGERTLRYDDTLKRPQRATPTSWVRLGWIPLGRDLSLEQEILHQLRARLQGGP